MLLLASKTEAFHIVGGEMIYDKLSGNNYRITLKIYRDCLAGPNASNFDGLINSDGSTTTGLITVRTAISNSLINTYDIGVPILTHIPPTINSPCIQTPGGICVDEGIYTYTLNLPALAGGYYIIYQRGNRNGSILNLTQPAGQSATYYAKIPGPEDATNNNSPRYKNFPPIFICNNVTFTFDHSAIDPDGDQLVYSLCPPFMGDPCCSVIGGIPPVNPTQSCPTPPSSCPTEAAGPPYANVNYVTGYNGNYPISSSPAFSINPSTGVLTGKPNLIGQFVVCICVQEFRNGILIDTHFRDFQFNVVPCIVSAISIIADPYQNTISGSSQKCIGLVITFTNQSVNQSNTPTYLWDFGVGNITSDTSSSTNPTYTYADTGTYVVSLITNPGKPCTDTVKKTFYVYPPLKIKFPPHNKQCLVNNAFNFNVTGVYLNSTIFKWDFTSAATPSTATTLTVNNVTFNQAGLYFIKLKAKQFACLDSFIDSIRVIRRPKAKINNLGNSLCDPANVAFTNGSTSDLPLAYLWQFSNGNSSTAFEPTEVFTPTGIYGVTLTVKTTSLCIDTSVFAVSNITVNPKPLAGFTFSPQITTIFDPDIFFNNTASNDVVNWNYAFGDGSGTSFPSEAHRYQEYGDYVITQIVNNQFGCYDTIQQTVKILPEFRFWIPNCFTPDENLLNDFFMPIAIGVINYEFEIFDKWGERIFKTNNPKQGWNGFYKSKECKQDEYVWRITFRNVVTEKNEIHAGHVTLLKNL